MNCGCGTCESTRSGAITHGGGFSRPNFFAGQLLTEDDLDALVEYTVAKDRLHNRHLHGDGVVCGLWVSCAPCEPAQIVVGGGYALDCCGRDIVVDCDLTLDINELIAALPRHACLDPCEAPKQPGKKQPGKKHTGRCYTLVVVASEEATELLAPYPSGDDCGPVDATTCQPSRVIEGVRFELRCDVPPPAMTSVADRFLACIGVLEPSRTMRGVAETLLESVVNPRGGRTATRYIDELIKRADIGTLDWLECRLQESDLPPCGMLERVRCLRRSNLDAGRADDERGEDEGDEAGTELHELIREYVLECLCRAINPPCPPCPDVAVTLATVEVEACKVTRICNAARRYVITQPTLSYWIPGLERIYENVRALCCAPCHDASTDEGQGREGDLGVRESSFEVSAATAGPAAPPTRYPPPAAAVPPAPAAKKATRKRAAKSPRRGS
jgi:hypothetical protein